MLMHDFMAWIGLLFSGSMALGLQKSFASSDLAMMRHEHFLLYHNRRDVRL